MLYKKISTKKHTAILGFSLVELLISISIIVLVSGVIVARNNSFEGAILLRNQAYLVASAVREAQLLAVSGAGFTSEVQRYGIFVNTAEGQKNTILVFRDDNDNLRYDEGEVVSVVRLDGRFQIDRIIDSSGTDRTSASITFLRPNYDATFSGPTNIINGPIHIQLRRVGRTGNEVGVARQITVTGSGQVSVTSLQ